MKQNLLFNSSVTHRINLFTDKSPRFPLAGTEKNVIDRNKIFSPTCFELYYVRENY